MSRPTAIPTTPIDWTASGWTNAWNSRVVEIETFFASDHPLRPADYTNPDTLPDPTLYPFTLVTDLLGEFVWFSDGVRWRPFGDKLYSQVNETGRFRGIVYGDLLSGTFDGGSVTTTAWESWPTDEVESTSIPAPFDVSVGINFTSKARYAAMVSVQAQGVGRRILRLSCAAASPSEIYLGSVETNGNAVALNRYVVFDIVDDSGTDDMFLQVRTEFQPDAGKGKPINFDGSSIQARLWFMPV